jgi:FixJ family two-component response regulator
MRMASVMIIDDDRHVSDGLCTMLHLRLPHLTIDPIPSPRTALDRLKWHECDLIITDLQMPELDGFELLRRARILRPYLPVVLLSGVMNSAVASRAIDIGAYDIGGKPIDRDALVTVVGTALEIAVLRRNFRARQIRVARLHQRIREAGMILQPFIKSNTNQHIHESIITSKRLGQKLLPTPALAMELLKSRAHQMVEQLHESERHLSAAYAESQRRARLKIRDGRL